MTKRATQAQVKQLQEGLETRDNLLKLSTLEIVELRSQLNNLTGLIRHYEQTLAIVFGRLNENCTLYSANNIEKMEEA